MIFKSNSDYTGSMEKLQENLCFSRPMGISTVFWLIWPMVLLIIGSVLICGGVTLVGAWCRVVASSKIIQRINKIIYQSIKVRFFMQNLQCFIDN